MSIICAIFTTILYDEEGYVLKHMWMFDEQKKGTTLQGGP